MVAGHLRGLALLGALAMTSGATAANAQSVEKFYRGKTVSMVIGYPPGGANDFYARTLARHIGKHIPGNPDVIARNMPGAGSIVAANYIFNVAPKDGTVLGSLAPTTPLEAALGSGNVKYKAAQFNWIGRMSSGINATVVIATSPVKSIKDTMHRQVVLGATGRAGASSVYPSVLAKVLDAKFKIIVGYKGTVEAFLAMERGEVEGHSTSWDGIMAVRGDWVRNKKVNVIVQYGIRPHPDLPDVPTSVDLARTDEERQILRIVASATEIGKLVLTAPGVPADRVEALRRAFDAMMRDPAYIEDMKKQRLELLPMTGEGMQGLVREFDSVSPAILAKVKALYPLN